MQKEKMQLEQPHAPQLSKENEFLRKRVDVLLKQIEESKRSWKEVQEY